MSVNFKLIKQAIDTLKEIEGDRYIRRGKYNSFDVSIKSILPPRRTEITAALYKDLFVIHSGYHMLDTILEKSEWMRKLWLEDKNIEIERYIQTDIEGFFNYFYSTMGYLCRVINNIHKMKYDVYIACLNRGSTNWGKLRNDCIKKSNFDESFKNIVGNSGAWYNKFNAIRKSLTHNRGRADVFQMIDARYVFQIFDFGEN